MHGVLNVPFRSAWVPSPWTGALDEVMHCHMCSQVRGWTVWLHWDAQMGSVEWLCRLGVPVRAWSVCHSVHLAVVVCSAKGRPGQVCTWRMPGTSVAGTGRTDCWELMGEGRVL